MNIPHVLIAGAHSGAGKSVLSTHTEESRFLFQKRRKDFLPFGSRKDEQPHGIENYR